MKQHIESIDYLRAIMSVFVVIWHLGGAGKTGLYTPGFAEHSIVWQDVVNFYVLLLAVPTFFFVSFYLFALKPGSIASLGKRLKRFFLLFVFWAVVFSLFHRGQEGLIRTLQFAVQDIGNFSLVFLSGMNTHYYFFASLFILVIFAFLFRRVHQGVLIGLFALSVISVATLPIVTEQTGKPIYSAYWNPLNFTPYLFLGLLFARNNDLILSNRNRFLTGAIITFLVAAIYEWNFLPGSVLLKSQTIAFPAYMRPSLVFAVAAIAILLFSSRLRSNVVVGFMSNYSLALFCLHSFFVMPVRRYIGIDDFADTLLCAAIIVALSYVTAFILKHFLAREILF